ncbi:hypothetical protein ACM614_21955 [Streptomyces sp. 12297]
MNGTTPTPILTAAPDAIQDRPAAVRPTARALPGAAPPSPCRPGRPGEEHPGEAA